MRRTDIVRAVAILVFAGGATMMGMVIQAYGHPLPVAACHSPTEDSTPTDCDYHDGGWYQR